MKRSSLGIIVAGILSAFAVGAQFSHGIRDYINSPSFSYDDYQTTIMERNIQEEVPEELTVHLGISYPNLFDAMKAAGEFNEGKANLRDYLWDKISARAHCFRYPDNPQKYEEQVDQLNEIENIITLTLIKKYVDYFEREENQAKIFELITSDLANPYSEEGGFVVYDAGLEFIRYNIRDNPALAKKPFNNKSYKYPPWNSIIRHVGIFHLHAAEDDSSRFCGPSGDKYGARGNDLGVLATETELNPYQMNVVITKLAGQNFNVDLFFYDVQKDKPIGYARVLDLGIFSKITP